MPERPANAPPIPLSRLGELRGWYLSVQCSRCGRRVIQSLAALAERHGASLPLWRLAARLRCQALTRSGAKCAGKPDRVTLVQGRERRKDFLVCREIVVLDDRIRITG